MTEVITRRGAGSRAGYAVVLLGAALFVAGCFLPYYESEVFAAAGGSRTVSLYQQLSSGPFGGSDVGTLLFLFGGVAPVALIAIAGAARGALRTLPPAVVAAAVAAWSPTWFGVLLRQATFDIGLSLEIGFWVQVIAIGVAIIGTVTVLASARRGAHEPGSGA